MADLVTHACVALLPGAAVRSRYLGAVVVGTVLPDVVARLLPLALMELQDRGVDAVSGLVRLPWSLLHTPFALLLLCGALSFAVIERHRVGVLVGMLIGCASHLGLDLLQDHHGQGYLLLAPFSRWRFELGLIGSEATVSVAPWLAALTAGAWAIRWARSGRREAAGAATEAAGDGPSPDDIVVADRGG